jgi:hypothetical protein
MTKLNVYPPLTNPADIQPDISAYPSAQGNAPDPQRRLVVLVPADSDYTAATRRIWELAVATGSSVLLLSLCKDKLEEPSLRRQLVTMSALVRDGRISAEANVEIGTNWLHFVKASYQAGDMIVCFAEQRAGLLHRPLREILQSNLDAPVYILSGLYAQNTSGSDRLSQLIAWMGSFGILAGFFWLQVRISQQSDNLAQTLLLIMSAIVEFWLILLWNNLFG